MFLYERSLSFSEVREAQQLGLNNAKAAMNEVGVRLESAALIPAPDDICGGSSATCSINYYDHISQMGTSNSIKKLRKKHGADLVVFLRKSVYRLGNGSFINGVATTPNFPNISNATKYAFAIVHYDSTRVYLHEIGHLFGAKHAYQDGNNGPSRAFINVISLNSASWCPFPHKRGIFTPLGYGSTCEKLTREKWNQPRCSYRPCMYVNRFSDNSQVYMPEYNFTYYRGWGEAHKNLTTARQHAPHIINYSESIHRNAGPTAIIKIGSRPPYYAERGYILNATQSIDPDGDELSYKWKAIDTGSGDVIATGTEERFRLKAPRKGGVKIELVVDDGFGKTSKDTKQLTMGFQAPKVTYNLNRMLGLFVYWDEVEGASYYEVGHVYEGVPRISEVFESSFNDFEYFPSIKTRDKNRRIISVRACNDGVCGLRKTITFQCRATTNTCDRKNLDIIDAIE